MRLRDTMQILDELIPLCHAEPWDNVGLLVGDPDQSVTRALLAIDATPAVLQEAQKWGAELLVAYHPPLFRGIKRLTPSDSAFVAAVGATALYSPHTALDAAKGGTNDVLADAAGALDGRRPLISSQATERFVRLTFYAPHEAASTLAQSFRDLASGGSARSAPLRLEGNWEGIGRGRPTETVSREGHNNHVSERRFDLLVDKRQQTEALAVLRRAALPFDPAVSVAAIEPGEVFVGQGRIGDLAEASRGTVQEVSARIAASMGVKGYHLASRDSDRRVHRIAFAAGAGDDLLTPALDAGADLFVTGEMRHHYVLAALARGTSVLCLSHDGSERAALPPLAKRLRHALPDITFHIAQNDRPTYAVCLV